MMKSLIGKHTKDSKQNKHQGKHVGPAWNMLGINERYSVKITQSSDGWIIETISRLRTFSSIKSSYGIKAIKGKFEGKYYYEVDLKTDYLMQIGFATNKMTSSIDNGTGVGDDSHGWAVDGYRNIKWHNSKHEPLLTNKSNKNIRNTKHNTNNDDNKHDEQKEKKKKVWNKGDRIGLGIDLSKKRIECWLNGKSIGVIFDNIKLDNDEILFPSFSLQHPNTIEIIFDKNKFHNKIPNGYKSFLHCNVIGVDTDNSDSDEKSETPGSLTSKESEKVDGQFNLLLEKVYDSENDKCLDLSNVEISGNEMARLLHGLIVMEDDRLFGDIIKQYRKKIGYQEFGKVFINKEGFGTKKNLTLLEIAAQANNMEIVKTLVEMNAIIKFAIYFPIQNNNISMLRYFMTKFGNPNYVSASLRAAADHGNEEMMKVLLNMDDKGQPLGYRWRFNWDKTINDTSEMGYSVFLLCCQNNGLKCLEYLFSIEMHFKSKINIFQTTTAKQNGLHIACGCQNSELAIWLIENVYNRQTMSTEIDNPQWSINDKTAQGETVFHKCASFGLTTVMEAILKEYGDAVDVTSTNRSHYSPFSSACMHDQAQCVSWMLRHPLLTDKISANINTSLGKLEHSTPLQLALRRGNIGTVKVLCDCDMIKLSDEAKNASGGHTSTDENELDFCVFRGNIPCFSTILSTMFKRFKINSMNDLDNSGILKEEKILKWLDWCQERKHYGMYSFLTKLNENGLGEKNFSLIMSLLDVTNESDDNDDISNLYQFGRQSQKRALYLFNHLDKSSLVNISKVVNNALLKQECGFDDSLLFLSKLVNNEMFNDTLEKVTSDCLANETRNVKKHYFFRNNLLNSNIWAVCVNGDTDDSDVSGVPVSSRDQLLFDRINEKIISKEMVKIQKYIKSEIVAAEKTLEKQFKELKNSIKYFNLGKENRLSQRQLINAYEPKVDLMKDMGIESEYELNELPYDNVNGFDGKTEYDSMGYLTKLLMASHQIDPIFQKEAKKYFDINNFGIKCDYKSAPVKTRQRAAVKSKLDYKHLEWPYCQHILDYIRCSIVFDNLEDLLKGFNKFYADYRNVDNDSINSDTRKGCIKCIVRLKNDFYSIKDESWNLHVKSFNYRDIKCNVLIEYNNIRIIGEVQFLIGYMLNAKKMSHSIYEYLRKEELYNKLGKLINVNYQKSDVIFSKLNKILLVKSMAKLSLFLENLQSHETKFIIEKEKDIVALFKRHEWNKGLELYQAIVEAIKSKQT